MIHFSNRFYVAIALVVGVVFGAIFFADVGVGEQSYAQSGGSCTGVSNRTQCYGVCDGQFPVISSSRSSSRSSAASTPAGNLNAWYSVQSITSFVVQSGTDIHFTPLSRPVSGSIYRPFALLSLQNNASTQANITRFFFNANVSGVSIRHLPDYLVGSGYQKSPLRICNADVFGDSSCTMTNSSGVCSDLRATLTNASPSCGYTMGIAPRVTKNGVTTISIPVSALVAARFSSPVRVTLGVDYHRNTGTAFTATTKVTAYYQSSPSGFFFCPGEPNLALCSFYRFSPAL